MAETSLYDDAMAALAAAAAFEARGEKIDPDDQVEFDRALEKARTALESERFDALWAEGRVLSVGDALA
jgi:hypothetical protein